MGARIMGMQEIDSRQQNELHEETPTPSPAGHIAFPIVGIGASAGGIPALLTLLENMPRKPGMALVEMVAPELRLPLRAALLQARQGGRETRTGPLRRGAGG